ncbi:hypothetical protein D3C80_1302660 [compost metagenome]
MRQVAWHVGQQHVVGHVGRDHDTYAHQQASPVLGGDLFERGLRRVLNGRTIVLFHFVHMLLERWRFFQGVAQIQANHTQRCCQEERNTPAPVEEVGLTDDAGDKYHHTSP